MWWFKSYKYWSILIDMADWRFGIRLIVEKPRSFYIYIGPIELSIHGDPSYDK